MRIIRLTLAACLVLLLSQNGCVVSVDEPFVLGTAEYADKILPEYEKMVDNAYRQDGVDGEGNPKFVKWFKEDDTRKIRHEFVEEFRELIRKGKRVVDGD